VSLIEKYYCTAIKSSSQIRTKFLNPRVSLIERYCTAIKTPMLFLGLKVVFVNIPFV
jgi:hypothetical protein